MPISPLDMITMVPKTQDAVQFKHAETQKPVQQQNYINQNFQQNVQQNAQKTVAMTGKDALNFTYDAKEKGNNEYQDNRNKKQQNKKNETTQNKRTGGIDLLI